jgi:hypothetical protein
MQAQAVLIAQCSLAVELVDQHRSKIEVLALELLQKKVRDNMSTLPKVSEVPVLTCMLYYGTPLAVKTVKPERDTSHYHDHHQVLSADDLRRILGHRLFYR